MKKIKLIILAVLIIPLTLSAQVRPEIHTFSNSDQVLLCSLMQQYITVDVINTHHMGGGTHSDLGIVPFHKLYLEGMEDYLMLQGYPQFVPLPSWDPTLGIPSVFHVVDADCSQSLYPSDCVTPTAAQWAFVQDPVTWPGIINQLSNCTTNPVLDWAQYMSFWNSNIHGVGHGGVGGVMSTMTSPAAPIFWLWHAYIDDLAKIKQCNCNFIPNLDLSVNDVYEPPFTFDDGLEPSIFVAVNDKEWFESPDVWVRNQNDGMSNENHQNPVAGATNYVYVRIRNRSCTSSAATGDVCNLYWAKTENILNNMNYPVNFNGTVYPGTSLFNGNFVGSSSIPQIDAGESIIVEIQWQPVAYGDYSSLFPSSYTEFTLMTKIVVANDPSPINVTSISLPSYISECNSVASKNVTLAAEITFASTSTNDMSCTAVCDGEANFSLIVSPGTVITSYTWSDGISNTGSALPTSRQSLCSGTYSLTITTTNNTYTHHFVVGPATVSSKWHKSSENITGQNDNIIDVLTDPNTNEVYVLGEFTGQTNMDFPFDAGAYGNEGVFIVKYDECGSPLWGVHSNFTTIGVTFKINALQLQFNGSMVRVYGQWDNNTGTVGFDMYSSTPPQNTTGVGVSGSNKNVFSIDIDALGIISNSTSYALKFPTYTNINGVDVLTAGDQINQVWYVATNSTTYFAGEFDNGSSLHAGVKKHVGSTLSDPIEDSQPGNVITAIVVENSDIYAVGNMLGNYNFGLGSGSLNGSIQEGIILKYDNSSSQVSLQQPAGSNSYASVNDIALNGTKLWVAAEFNVELGNWSSLYSSTNSAMVIEFNLTLSPLQSFFIDENAIGGLQQASAQAISISGNQMYVAGTFTGSSLVIGNNSYTTAPSMISGSGNTSDLWLAKFDLATNQFNWIEGSSSQEEVFVTDVNFDGRNAYLAGSFLNTIDFQNNVTNLNHPNPGSNYYGYVVRGGDFLSSGGQGQYYKTGTHANSTAQTVNDLTNGSALVLYPNPNNGTFALQYHAEITGTVTVNIYDATGRLVYNHKFDKSANAFNQTISTEQLPTGLYMLGMELNGETQYQKFIVQ